MCHTKYPTILSVVKVVFLLTHDNADVEKGFSDSGKTVTLNVTCHSEASVSNLQIAIDKSKVFGSLPQHVPVTPSFIKLGQSAHKNHHLRIEEEWKKEVEKRRQEPQARDEKMQIQEKKKRS